MQRRTFIASTTSTIATASIAGCSGILGGNGGGSGPDDAAETYIEAAASGDGETLKEYTLPEGPAAGGTARGTPAGASVSVEPTEALERSDGAATVAIEVEATQASRSATVDYEFDVRQHEGQWKVYDFSIVS